MADKLAGRRRKSPPRATVASLTPDHAALCVPPAPGEPARLVWLGHASWLVQIAGVSLLVDPVLGDGILGFSATVTRRCRWTRSPRSPRSS